MVSRLATSPDGIPIAYEVVGDGVPQIGFVHGWACDRSYWRHQMDAFSGKTVIAVDLAGHGDSGFDRGSWTMPAFGADVVAVIDELGLDGVVLVGHSTGGDGILEAALVLGDRVRGLVWVDTYRSLEDPLDAAEIESFLAPFRVDFAGRTQDFVRDLFPPSTDVALVDWIASDMAAAPPEIAIDAMQHAIENQAPAIGALARLKVQVAAINPDYRPTDEASLRRHGVSPLIMSGVGHFPMLEDPDQFNRVLTGVINGLR
jgi:pimeloyl-ACP methyl ester carboxylesterase